MSGRRSEDGSDVSCGAPLITTISRTGGSAVVAAGGVDEQLLAGGQAEAVAADVEVAWRPLAGSAGCRPTSTGPGCRPVGVTVPAGVDRIGERGRAAGGRVGQAVADLEVDARQPSGGRAPGSAAAVVIAVGPRSTSSCEQRRARRSPGAGS